MHSDWHRYNLKRRVTSLPPITSEVFTEKVLQAQASSNAAATKAAFEKSCTICQRTYFSENAYKNHIKSLKHRTKQAGAGRRRADDETESVMSSTFSLGEPIATSESVDSDSEEDVHEVMEGIKKTNLKENASTTPRQSEGSVKTASSITESEGRNLKLCLFCSYESPTIELSASHMAKMHEMFIPEKEYLVDLEGLLGSLHEKIHEFHECLYCGKLKSSIFGLQTHMRDVGHCKIPFDTEDEQLDIGEFYDFRSTYSDLEDDSDSETEVTEKQQRGGAKLGMKRHARTNENNYGNDEKMEDGDGWETDSSESSLDSADLTAVPLEQRTHSYQKLGQHPHHSHSDPRPHLNKDGWHSHAHKHTHAVFYSDYELHLPSGRTAGHRSLNKYFRQNLHNHPSPAERQEQEQLAIEAGSDSGIEEGAADERALRRVHGERGRELTTRSNNGMLGVSTEKVKEVHAAEKRTRRVEEAERRRIQWRNNKQSNMQKHFRDPLLQ